MIEDYILAKEEATAEVHEGIFSGEQAPKSIKKKLVKTLGGLIVP